MKFEKHVQPQGFTPYSIVIKVESLDEEEFFRDAAAKHWSDLAFDSFFKAIWRQCS